MLEDLLERVAGVGLSVDGLTTLRGLAARLGPGLLPGALARLRRGGPLTTARSVCARGGRAILPAFSLVGSLLPWAFLGRPLYGFLGFPSLAAGARLRCRTSLAGLLLARRFLVGLVRRCRLGLLGLAGLLIRRTWLLRFLPRLGLTIGLKIGVSD